MSTRNIAINDMSTRNIAINDMSTRNIATNDMSIRNIATNDMSIRNIAMNDMSIRNIAINDMSILSVRVPTAAIGRACSDVNTTYVSMRAYSDCCVACCELAGRLWCTWRRFRRLCIPCIGVYPENLWP